MTFEIGLVLGILVAAVVLFVLEKPRADVVAILVMVTLPVAGLLDPLQALEGFANPAVVTVGAVFILSAGLLRTGVANLLGRQILRLTGSGEVRLLIVIMVVSGVLSGFMNNVGATALLLPVVMDISRQTGIAPSKLLIPLSFSSLLGGMTTLIGTPPNIVVSRALEERGFAPLEIFDFAPVGGAVLVAGILYIVLIGRRFLPDRDIAAAATGADLRSMFGLHKRLLVLHVPPGSALAGKTVAQSRIASALELTVIGVIRDGQTRLAPSPDDLIREDDRLLVEGRPTRLKELRENPSLSFGTEQVSIEHGVSSEIELHPIEVAAGSELVGRTLRGVDFRNRWGSVVVAIRRGERVVISGMDVLELQEGDLLLLQSPHDVIGRMAETEHFRPPSTSSGIESWGLDRHLLRLRLPEGSDLVGKTLAESRLAEAFGLMVLALERSGASVAMPAPTETFQPGDALVVKGEPESLATLAALQGLTVERAAEKSVEAIESATVGLTVAALAPNASLARKSLRRLAFREKYGLTVLAVWRQGRVLRKNLANLVLEFGDALLLYGPRQKLSLLAEEGNFLVLTQEAQEPPRFEKAPWALVSMGSVLALTLSGWLPIYVSAVIGAALMVLTGCLKIEEGYREIEWRAVILIAGMLPLGAAMEQTGAALYLAEKMVALAGGFGPLAIVAGLFLFSMVGAQAMPTAAVAVLVAPIALDTAAQMGLSPQALVMAIAIGASTSFISPVTHPANVLVMGPGGYRFTDYPKVGVPLTLVILGVVLFVLPRIWPL